MTGILLISLSRQRLSNDFLLKQLYKILPKVLNYRTVLLMDKKHLEVQTNMKEILLLNGKATIHTYIGHDSDMGTIT